MASLDDGWTDRPQSGSASPPDHPTRSDSTLRASILGSHDPLDLIRGVDLPGQLSLDGAEAVPASGGGRSRPDLLDKRCENREKRPDPPLEPLGAALSPDEVAAKPYRSGGPHDPRGTRGVDVTRADALVAGIDARPGRWCIITLTVDRSQFINPEACYQACQDRVREVVRRLLPDRRRLWVSALEIQEKTGEGWPHWHLLVWMEGDTRAAGKGSVLQAEVERAWSIKAEIVDQDTGEVTRGPLTRIGFVSIEDVRSREGAVRYCMKYLLKPWSAMPFWIGDSHRQFRKLRISPAMFDHLQALGLYERRRGSRRVPSGRRRARARRLFERMADSGSKTLLFRAGEDRPTQYAGTIEAYPEDLLNAAVADGVQYRLLQRGSDCVRVFKAPDLIAVAERHKDELKERQVERRRQRLLELENAWDFVQAEREQRDMEREYLRDCRRRGVTFARPAYPVGAA